MHVTGFFMCEGSEGRADFQHVSAAGQGIGAESPRREGACHGIVVVKRVEGVVQAGRPVISLVLAAQLKVDGCVAWNERRYVQFVIIHPAFTPHAHRTVKYKKVLPKNQRK